MKISLKTTVPTDAPVSIVLNANASCTKHRLFSFLTKGERDYLRSIDRSMQTRLRATHNAFLTLPTGRALFIFHSRERSVSARDAFVLMRKAVAAARTERIGSLALFLDDFTGGMMRTAEDAAEAIAIQCSIANYDFRRYKNDRNGGNGDVASITIVVRSLGNAVTRAAARGAIIGSEINAARTLSNTPGGDMTPAVLAEAARRACARAGVKIKVLDEKAMRTLKMGGILGVAKGSNEPPRFVVMEYLKGPRTERPVVLVGKGVTFDTGGLNLKPTDYIYEMHMDMSGGASVLHTIIALARIGAKKNVIGLIPAVENMPSGSSYRPGDVLQTMSGITVEVMNTDAEGRIILADAITYALRYRPRLIVDVATLTGAAQVALGQRASALFATSAELERRIRDAGERTGDFVWPLPLWKEYEEEIQGTFGDVSNAGKTKYGGAITGAMFLWQFVKGFPPGASMAAQEKRHKAPPWAHLDISPRMTSIDGDYLSKGAAGAAINLLTHLLLSY